MICVRPVLSDMLRRAAGYPRARTRPPRSSTHLDVKPRRQVSLAGTETARLARRLPDPVLACRFGSLPAKRKA
jgi:hypothetical protein